MARRRKCPTPQKLVFTSHEHAESTLRYWNYDDSTYRPVRTYLCRCGNYHLTSQP